MDGCNTKSPCQCESFRDEGNHQSTSPVPVFQNLAYTFVDARLITAVIEYYELEDLKVMELGTGQYCTEMV